jgi:hypothetical protein
MIIVDYASSWQLNCHKNMADGCTSLWQKHVAMMKNINSTFLKKKL